MRIAVLQVVLGKDDDPQTQSTFWNLAKFTRSEDHDVHLPRIEAASSEGEIRAVLERGYHVLLVEAPISSSRISAVVESVAQLRSPSQLFLGPSLAFLQSRQNIPRLDFPSFHLATAGLAPANGSGVSLEGDSFIMAALALGVGSEIIVFGPAVRSPSGFTRFPSSSGQKLQDSIVSALTRCLGPEVDHGAYGMVRVDILVEIGKEMYHIVKVDRNPQLFLANGSSFDDELVKAIVPGGHPALLDFVIYSQLAKSRNLVLEQKVADLYAGYAPIYDNGVREVPYYASMQGLVSDFRWAGSVLDLGCGTGLLGELLHRKNEPFTITGVDLSPDMLAAPAIGAYYSMPVITGPMQAAIMQSGTYDHLACFGALVYLDEVTFTSFLCRMFMVARQSITFDIEDVQEAYIKKHADNSSILPSYNHTSAFRRFRIPDGWQIVYDKHEMLYYDYDSDETNRGIFDTVIRIEKVQPAS